MKKINLLRFIAIATIATLAFISCSKDADTNSTAQSLTIAQQNLKDQFANIVKTNEYVAFQTKTRDFATNLKVATADLTDRNSFGTWLDRNLSLTNFASKTAALRAYDDAVTATDTYMKLNQNFYDELVKNDRKDIKDILSPEFVNPVQVQTNSTPCQNDCMDKVEDNMTFAEDNYADAIRGHHDFHTLFRAKTEFFLDLEWIVGNFNDCMGSC